MLGRKQKRQIFAELGGLAWESKTFGERRKMQGWGEREWTVDEVRRKIWPSPANVL